jgi:hypothetical protein
MRNLRPIFIGILAALCFVLFGFASTSFAGSVDLAVSSLNANVNGSLIKFTAVLKSNGPDTIPSSDFAALIGDLDCNQGSGSQNGITIDTMTCQGHGPFVPGETSGKNLEVRVRVLL